MTLPTHFQFQLQPQSKCHIFLGLRLFCPHSRKIGYTSCHSTIFLDWNCLFFSLLWLTDPKLRNTLFWEWTEGKKGMAFIVLWLHTYAGIETQSYYHTRLLHSTLVFSLTACLRIFTVFGQSIQHITLLVNKAFNNNMFSLFIFLFNLYYKRKNTHKAFPKACMLSH